MVFQRNGAIKYPQNLDLKNWKQKHHFCFLQDCNFFDGVR